MGPARNGDDGIAVRLEQLLGEDWKPGAVEGGSLHFPLCLILYQTWFSVLISSFSSPNLPSHGDLALREFLELKRGCIFFFGSVVSFQFLTGEDGPKDSSGTGTGGQSIPSLPACSGCFSCKCLVWHEGVHKALLKV